MRSQQRSQERLLAYLRSLAYERHCDVVFVPSVGWLRDRTEQHFYTVDAALDTLALMGKIAVARTPDGLWVDLRPQNT